MPADKGTDKDDEIKNRIRNIQNILKCEDIRRINEEFAGEIKSSFDEIKLNTRHFAKRQLTWFRREEEVIYVDKDEIAEEKLLDFCMKKMKSQEMI
ncbi:MAG: hypothetical protein K6G11_00690 [Lachnospiraceae bacterium]|nr:hypothetical protein [Lachnospiraceae bacterium]